MRIKFSTLSEGQVEELMKYFVAGVTARTAADLAGLNRSTVTAFFDRLRRAIARRQQRERAEAFDGEVDEGGFGSHRRGGKRGRGAPGEAPVSGILRRGGEVFTEMIGDTRRQTVLPIIERKVAPDGVAYPDTYNVYDTLNVEGYRHRRASHDERRAEEGRNHISGIENFWRQVRRHLRKFNGIPKSFHLLLRECEWRFNTGSPRQLLADLRLIVSTDPNF